MFFTPMIPYIVHFRTLRAADVWALALDVGYHIWVNPLGRWLLFGARGCIWVLLSFFFSACHLYVLLLTVCWRRWSPVSSVNNVLFWPYDPHQTVFFFWMRQQLVESRLDLEMNYNLKYNGDGGGDNKTCSVKICLNYESFSCPCLT